MTGSLTTLSCLELKWPVRKDSGTQIRKLNFELINIYLIENILHRNRLLSHKRLFNLEEAEITLIGQGRV